MHFTSKHEGSLAIDFVAEMIPLDHLAKPIIVQWPLGDRRILRDGGYAVEPGGKGEDRGDPS